MTIIVNSSFQNRIHLNFLKLNYLVNFIPKRYEIYKSFLSLVPVLDGKTSTKMCNNLELKFVRKRETERKTRQKKREGERETERETELETDRETQREIQRQRQRERHTHRKRERQS